MEQTPRQRAIINADHWMSMYIRERDKRCYTCGSRFQLTNGHLITRGKMGTRWEEENCKAQCIFCNSDHEINPAPYTDKWKREHGEEAYEALVLKSNTPTKLSVMEIREIGDKFRWKYRTLVKEGACILSR